MTIDGLLEDFGTPEGPPPVAPPWHVESDHCAHGWIIDGVEWGVCDCEDPAHPWPVRAPTDGPRDCRCAFCEGHKPRHERGRIASCEYKNHHCDDCHEQQRCTVIECGFGLRLYWEERVRDQKAREQREEDRRLEAAWWDPWLAAWNQIGLTAAHPGVQSNFLTLVAARCAQLEAARERRLVEAAEQPWRTMYPICRTCGHRMASRDHHCAP